MKTSNTLNIVLALTLLVLIVKTSFLNTPQKATSQKSAIESIMARTSIRKYLDKDVEESKINTLLKAGMAAPTGYDKRPWQFVVVKDSVTLNKLGDHANNSRQAIIVCGDTSKSALWVQDCSAAAENILVAATALDLGAVWTAGYPDEQRVKLISEAAKLPSNIVPLCVIVFGYPAMNQPAKDKYNPSMIHLEKY